MNAKDAVASREVFDAWTAARLAKCIDDPEQRAKIAERQYPRSTAQAVDELHYRGFDADEQRAERFAKQNKVETFGDCFAWYRSDIDALAEACHLNTDAQHRVLHGITWGESHV